MKKSGNIVRQESAGVIFGVDCRNGAIQYASFGGRTTDRKQFTPTDDCVITPTNGGLLNLMVLWVLGFQFGVKNAVNDLLDKIVPIISYGLAGKKDENGVREGLGSAYRTEHINNVLTDVWMRLSGNVKDRKNKAVFDPDKGTIVTWILYLCRKQRQDVKRWSLKSMLGLDDILDQQGKGDMTPTNLTDLLSTFDRVARKEDEEGLKKVLANLPDKSRNMLEDYFIHEMDFVEIGIKHKMTTVGARKHILSVVNSLRRFYGIEGAVIGFGGETSRKVKIVDID